MKNKENSCLNNDTVIIINREYLEEYDADVFELLNEEGKLDDDIFDQIKIEIWENISPVIQDCCRRVKERN